MIRLVALGLLLLIGTGSARAESERDQVVDKAAGLVSDKVDTQRQRLRAAALALYRASRGLHTRSLMAPRTENHALLRAAWRVFLRDIRELEQLKTEQARLSAVRPTTTPPALGLLSPGSLQWPVPSGEVIHGFGVTKEADGDLEIVWRGVDLESEAGEGVRAVAAGTVLFVGPIRGVGEAILIAHKQDQIDYVSVLGGLTQPTVKPGVTVERGERLARAGGRNVYLEIRVRTDLVGTPVDPVPLLAFDGRSR